MISLCIVIVFGGNNCHNCNGWDECEDTCSECTDPAWASTRDEAKAICNGEDITQVMDFCAIWKSVKVLGTTIGYSYYCCRDRDWFIDRSDAGGYWIPKCNP